MSSINSGSSASLSPTTIQNVTLTTLVIGNIFTLGIASAAIAGVFQKEEELSYKRESDKKENKETPIKYRISVKK